MQEIKMSSDKTGAATTTYEPPLSCPDCGALFVDRQLLHDESCPLQAVVDEVVADDRDYFQAHPGVDIRHRPPVMGELINAFWIEGRSLPEPPAGHCWKATGMVIVRQLAEGCRIRDYREAGLVAVNIWRVARQ